MKMISVIIPHYNSWKKLIMLLQSIPNNPEIEAIVIDDNSEEVDYYNKIITDQFPNVLFLKNDTGVKGAGAARNKGLKYAKGSWLLFADADDLFTPHAFEKIEEFLHSESDIVYFRPKSFIENSTSQSDRHVVFANLVMNYIENPSLDNELKLRFDFTPPWSKLIRHNIIKQNDIYFEQSMHANDILFSAKVGYYAKKINASEEVIYLIRENEGSLTQSLTETSFRERFEEWLKYMQFIKKNVSPKGYKTLNKTAMYHLGKIYKDNLAFRNYLYVIKMCLKYRIPLFNNNILNPKYLYEFLKK